MATILTPTWSHLVPTAHPFEVPAVQATIAELMMHENNMGHSMLELHVPHSMPRLVADIHWHQVPGTGIGGANAYVLCYSHGDDTPPDIIIR